MNMPDLRDLAIVALTATRVAARNGREYRLDHGMLTHMGLTPDDIARVEKAVRDIEAFTEETLRALGQTVRPADAD